MSLLARLRRPAPTVSLISEHDLRVMEVWSLSRLDWFDMTWSERAHYRANVARAPKLQEDAR